MIPWAALLDAIRERPGWPSWLVLADALSERGDARGELIRLGHRIVAAPPEERLPLQLASGRIERLHAQVWSAFVPRPRPAGVELTFSHGFLWRIDLQRLDDEVLGFLDALLDHPESRAASDLALNVRPPVSVRDFARLVRARWARRFVHWKLSRVGLGPGHAHHLAALPDVRQLIATSNAFGDGGIITLARTGWTELRTLSVGESGFGSDGLFALSQAHWPKLERLHIGGPILGKLEIAALTSAVWFDQLRELDVSTGWLGTSGLRRLLAAPRGFEVLGLAHNRLGNRGLRLLTPRVLPQLRSLDVTGNEIDDQGLAAFVKLRWPQLRHVVWALNPLSERGSSLVDHADPPWVAHGIEGL